MEFKDKIVVITGGAHGIGKAKEMVQYAIDKAKVENCKAIRLDVLKGNTPALQEAYLTQK